MPYLKLQDFIAKHKNGVCINLIFADYVGTSKKVMIDRHTNKPVPVPGKIGRTLGKLIKCDYSLGSAKTGRAHRFILSDEKEAQAFLSKFPHGPSEVTPTVPCMGSWDCIVDNDMHLSVAKDLKLA